MVLLGCLVAQTRGEMFARGDNVVFVREPCNLFNPSCIKIGLSHDRCINLGGGDLEASRFYYKPVSSKIQ